MPEPQIVRKSDFAALRGVTPARVSQWIAEGKIKGDALVGEGRAALINAAIATAQLKAALDVNQRFGLNGLATRLGIDPEPPRTSVAAGSDTVEAQIKAEKLRQAQLMTSRLEEEDRSRRGLYVDASSARGEITRAVSDLLRSFEGALPDFASAMSAKFQVPQRDALHLMRGEFRRLRDRLSALHAAAARSQAATIPADDPQPDGIQ